jgi:hypothetical protein
MILATQYPCHVGVEAAKGKKRKKLQHASIPDERGNKKAEFLYMVIIRAPQITSG